MKQGCVASPTLFAIYLDRVDEYVRRDLEQLLDHACHFVRMAAVRKSVYNFIIYYLLLFKSFISLIDAELCCCLHMRLCVHRG